MEGKELDTFPTTGATVHTIRAASMNYTDCGLPKSISCSAPSFLTSAEQITAVYHLPANISCPFMCTFSNSSKSRQVHYYLRMLTGTFQAGFLVDYELHTISAYELGHLMLTRVSALTLNTARQTRETSMCKSSLLFYKYYCRAPQAKL